VQLLVLVLDFGKKSDSLFGSLRGFEEAVAGEFW